MNRAHPPRELLADFAAEVLAPGAAQQVEAHVVACATCADQLAEAERMRSLLLIRDEPGAMPQEVWDRLLSAIDAEREVTRTGELPVSLPADLSDRHFQVEPNHYLPAAVSEFSPPELSSSSPLPEAVDRGAEPPQEAPTDDSTKVISLDQSSRDGGRRGSSERGRRTARGEKRSSQPLLRLVRPLGIAAAILAVVSLAGVASTRLFSTIGGGQPSSATGPDVAAISSQDSEGAFAAVIQRSNTDYTRASLPGQVRQLAAQSIAGQPASEPTAASSTANSVTAQSSSELAAGAAGPTTSAGSRAAAPSQSAAVVTTDITDPQRLRECLNALEVGNESPIAIDLARYEGQDAAIVVLPGRDGGYEAWVVSRSCSANAPGLIDFYSVSPS